MENNNTNYGQAVTGVLIKDGKVLLGRHTYGAGKGKLIVPGGFVEYGETPVDAVRREFYEETRIIVEPKKLIGIRFNSHDWYAAFSVDYVSGFACSDNDENSEVLWIDVEEALQREDVPNLTKHLIKCALREEEGFPVLPYQGKLKYGIEYLFGVDYQK